MSYKNDCCKRSNNGENNNTENSSLLCVGGYIVTGMGEALGTHAMEKWNYVDSGFIWMSACNNGTLGGYWWNYLQMDNPYWNKVGGIWTLENCKWQKRVNIGWVDKMITYNFIDVFTFEGTLYLSKRLSIVNIPANGYITWQGGDEALLMNIIHNN